MFVRSRVARGTVYYNVVENERVGGRVVQRHVAQLGREPDVAAALARVAREAAGLRAELRRLAVIYPEGEGMPAWARREGERLARRLGPLERRLAGLERYRRATAA